MEEFCSKFYDDASNTTINRRTLKQDDGTEQKIVYLTSSEQKEVLDRKYYECVCQMYTKPHVLTGKFCNRTWDNIMCWEDTPAGTTAYQRCPSYINNFRTQYNASRTCLLDGTWTDHPYVNGSMLNGWTNYTGCHYNGTVDRLDEHQSENVPNIFKDHFNKIQLLYNVGYTFSLASLIVAFTIMIYFRKLHCSRNTIHLHLFASFIFRAAISLIRDNFMVAGIGFPMDVSYNDTGGIVVFKEGPHWECRLFFAIFQYTIVASNVWIFIEAVYLHMLIFVSVFTESVKVRWYILFGWIFPLIFILAWCISRHVLDNTLCWNTHGNRPALVWILQSPIMVTIVLNFVFFISIIRVLYTKLKSPQCPDTKKNRYRRLARSTLFLIPTFGVYYIIFTIPSTKFNDTAEFVMFFIEMFLNSFQGFFIALVLCFINAEVRIQIKKSWQRSKWCPCYNPIGLSTKTDYLRCQSLTHAESKRDNFQEPAGVEMQELHNMNGHNDNNIHNREHEPFLHTVEDNCVTNGACDH